MSKAMLAALDFSLDLPTLGSPASGRATARLPDLFLSQTTLFSDSLCCHSGTLSFLPLLPLLFLLAMCEDLWLAEGTAVNYLL